MSKFTIKNGVLMTAEEAAKTERKPNAKRAAQLGRFGDGSPVSVENAIQNTAKKGGK